MLVKIETTKVGESKIQCKDIDSVQKGLRLVLTTYVCISLKLTPFRELPSASLNFFELKIADI
jgi:hypothetical protein